MGLGLHIGWNRLRALLAALTLLALTVIIVSPAAAQPVPSVLEEVRVVGEDEQQAAFALRFSPREPEYSEINRNPRRPELIMRTTIRAPRVPERSRYRGLVRAASFAVADTGLVMRFETILPARVAVEPAGPRMFQVKVTRISEDEAIGARPLGSSGEVVVPATNLPAYVDPYPGDAYELVFLKYADVSEIVGLLSDGATVKPNNVFIRREPGFGSMSATSGTSYVSPSSQGTPEPQPLGESVDANMAIDRRLNAIWLRGSPERIERLKAQIALIDVPVDSVILETQFVELTDTGVRNLGIDFNNASGQLAVGTIQRGGFAPFGTDLKQNVVSGSIQAALYAQVAQGNGRIVSTPRIAAQSGQTAKILTGDALPILTSITLSGVNAVSQQVQYVNVGVTLQIAPRVSPDGFVTSHIYAVVSSVTGFQQGYPTISQREAETSASVRDGETFVIGGLTIDNALATKSKIPILGDIPLVGRAFRVDKTNASKTDLFVVITPRIVRHRRFEQSRAAESLPPVESLPAPQSD